MTPCCLVGVIKKKNMANKTMEINKSRRNLVSTNVLQVKGSPKFGQTDSCEVKVQMNMIKITTTHMTFCTSFFYMWPQWESN